MVRLWLIRFEVSKLRLWLKIFFRGWPPSWGSEVTPPVILPVLLDSGEGPDPRPVRTSLSVWDYTCYLSHTQTHAHTCKRILTDTQTGGLLYVTNVAHRDLGAQMQTSECEQLSCVCFLHTRSPTLILKEVLFRRWEPLQKGSKTI